MTQADLIACICPDSRCKQHPAPEVPPSETRCPECADGTTTTCCRHSNECGTGRCDGPYPAQCERCYGTGKVAPTPPPSETVDLDGGNEMDKRGEREDEDTPPPALDGLDFEALRAQAERAYKGDPMYVMPGTIVALIDALKAERAKGAELRKLVRRVSVTGERWHDAWAKRTRWECYCQSKGVVSAWSFEEEFDGKEVDEDAIHDEEREAESEHMTALAELRVALAATDLGPEGDQ